MSPSQDLSRQLGAVKESAQRLNAVADRAAETVRAVEEFLSIQCSVGVDASVKVREFEEQAGGYVFRTVTQLMYCRVGQRFRIAVGTYMEPQDEDDITPWSDCKRDTKLETIAKLPDLLAEIARAVNRKIDDAERSVAVVEDVLAALRK